MDTNNLNLNHIQKRNKLFALDINSTIKKTYALLSFCILSSIVFAYFGLIINFRINILVFFLISYGTIYIMNRNKDNYIGLFSLFFLTSFLGFYLGPILNTIMFQHINGSTIIGASLALTSITFLSLSFYAMATKKNFNFLSGLLSVMSLLLIFLIILNIFLQIPILHLILSGLIALFSAAMILHTTSNMIYNRGERNCILITASLFLDIYNLFLSFLYIMGIVSGKDE